MGDGKFLEFLVVRYSISFTNGCLASEARQPEGKSLWVSTGGRCGYVVKPGVLRACPHNHADPLLVHQATLLRRRTVCLIFQRLPLLHICR